MYIKIEDYAKKTPFTVGLLRRMINSSTIKLQNEEAIE